LPQAAAGKSCRRMQRREKMPKLNKVVTNVWNNYTPVEGMDYLDKKLIGSWRDVIDPLFAESDFIILCSF
jgi:mRNA-degrading endonuclease YafQ of YafQ-DinJ toxin-antitoxin module